MVIWPVHINRSANFLVVEINMTRYYHPVKAKSNTLKILFGTILGFWILFKQKKDKYNFNVINMKHTGILQKWFNYTYFPINSIHCYLAKKSAVYTAQWYNKWRKRLIYIWFLFVYKRKCIDFALKLL